MQELCQEGHGDCGERGGEMIKLVAHKDRCDVCHYGKDHMCKCPQDKECGSTGYFIEVKSPLRPTKYERLLKALLKVVNVYDDGLATCNCCKKMDTKTAKQLIAIKEAMEKGAK